MSSPLGLTKVERYNARQRVKRSAMLTYHHRGVVHYTQGSARWQGITRGRHSSKGTYPNYADCSALSTWCLWDATRIHVLGDFVNGVRWSGGFTGTMTQHGVRVVKDYLLVGDCVFYGGTFSTPGHVAIVVSGGKLAEARVISHGAEAGPQLLPATYRPVVQIRRYIR